MKSFMQLSAIILNLLMLSPLCCGQQIWLAPRGPDSYPNGVRDWDKLFHDSAEWSALASKINVFDITAGYVIKTSDQDLIAATSNLESHHIGLAIALQSIARTAADSCGNEEGYGQTADSRYAAAKLHRLGINLQYIELDEPLWFGHFSEDPNSCKLTLEELAKRVSENVNEYLAFFPKATLGDIEPAPGFIVNQDWQTNSKNFYRSLALFTGKPVAFLHLDVAWYNPGWRKSVRALFEFAHENDLRLGIIYNGDGRDTTNESWTSAAVSHFEEIESQPELPIDDGLMASWDSHPDHVLPDTSKGSLGYVVASYSRPRTFFALQRKPNYITGHLESQAGLPVSGAGVRLTRTGLAPETPLPVRTITGKVPSEARSAIIGIRINTECSCAGVNDVSIGNISYLEQTSNRKEDYSLADEVKRRNNSEWEYHVKPILENPHDRQIVRIMIGADQRFGVNSPEFQVTPNSPFSFQVPLGSRSETGLYGSIVIIWLNEQKKGSSRTSIVLTDDADEVPISTTFTNQTGYFRFTLPAPTPYFFYNVNYTGTDTLRGASHTIR